LNSSTRRAGVLPVEQATRFEFVINLKTVGRSQ
jgi:hypothetical protein